MSTESQNSVRATSTEAALRHWCRLLRQAPVSASSRVDEGKNHLVGDYGVGLGDQPSVLTALEACGSTSWDDVDARTIGGNIDLGARRQTQRIAQLLRQNDSASRIDDSLCGRRTGRQHDDESTSNQNRSPESRCGPATPWSRPPRSEAARCSFGPRRCCAPPWCVDGLAGDKPARRAAVQQRRHRRGGVHDDHRRSASTCSTMASAGILRSGNDASRAALSTRRWRHQAP